LVTALANLSGNKLCRINLSDQTDLIDLFGSDLPVEGGTAGEFAWKDAEFLRALQEGNWVLLDEMNLAPQAVLEGLNAILDHRGIAYIPELNRSFSRHPNFRVFAAQNPLHQGGGRKGLPKSFVNRFTRVYLEELTSGDFYTVCSHIFPDIDESTLHAMISFNMELNQQVSVHRSFGQDGSPWEFNLRDIIRWGTLSHSKHRDQPHEYLRSVYLQRFRTPQDRLRACSIFDNTFGTVSALLGDAPPWTISPAQVQFGHFITTRNNRAPLSRPRRILKTQLAALESLGDCVSQSWLAILTGPRNSGKTDVVRVLADISGNHLLEVSINNATDTMDILGSFEQVDARRRLRDLLEHSITALDAGMRTTRGLKVLPIFQRQAHELWESCAKASIHQLRNICESFSDLLIKIAASDSTQSVHYQKIRNSLQPLSFSSYEVGHFEWVDGPLVKAMKSGHWLLLDGANLCDPSVLDRLNSLCESNGSLVLSERGFVDGKVQVVEPHPKFRLFMSVDPHHGELSRAMRNRGLEISLFATPLGDDVAVLRDYYRLPATSSSPSENPNLKGTIFEAVRRGLASSPFARFLQNVSSGRSLDQDSALSHLVDNVPALLIPLPEVADISWIYFLSRSLVPSYMPYIMRYLALRPQRELSPTIFEFINGFPHQDLNTALESFRQSYVVHKKISPPFILHQVTQYLVIGKSFVSFSFDFSRHFSIGMTH
jgi:midasin